MPRSEGGGETKEVSWARENIYLVNKRRTIMKRKLKFNCDDLAREIIERNLRGWIRKCEEEGESAWDSAEDDVNPDSGDGRSKDKDSAR